MVPNLSNKWNHQKLSQTFEFLYAFHNSTFFSSLILINIPNMSHVTDIKPNAIFLQLIIFLHRFLLKPKTLCFSLLVYLFFHTFQLKLNFSLFRGKYALSLKLIFISLFLFFLIQTHWNFVLFLLFLQIVFFFFIFKLMPMKFLSKNIKPFILLFSFNWFFIFNFVNFGHRKS